MGNIERKVRLPARLDPVARAVVARWRALTRGGEPTVVACSGGADSSALALCLGASEPGALTLCYVLHPMRSRQEVEEEARGVAELAEAIGAGFARADLPDVDENRREAGARVARYAALARVARELGIGFVATAHHADDQLETVLMALMRGAGPRGLAGIASLRRLDRAEPPVRLIRPMLCIGRADAERVCDESGWTPFEDPTNADEQRLRSAVRHRVAPVLRALRPGVSDASTRAGALLHDAARVVDDTASALLAQAERDQAGAFEWTRASMRRERGIVVGQALRHAALDLLGGAGGDRLTHRAIEPAVRIIKGQGTDPKRVGLTDRVRIRVDAHSVRVERLDPGAGV